MYHELVPAPPQRICSRLALVWLSLALGCADAHWASVRWPSEQPGAPRQPVLEAADLGLAVRATAIDYEPEAIVVGLSLENYGGAQLRIERRGIMLAWDELEYSVEAAEPEWIELEPQASAQVQLRYRLGRPLTGPGSRVLLRSVTRDGVAVVELPALELPAMPI